MTGRSQSRCHREAITYPGGPSTRCHLFSDHAGRHQAWAYRTNELVEWPTDAARQPVPCPRGLSHHADLCADYECASDDASHDTPHFVDGHCECRRDCCTDDRGGCKCAACACPSSRSDGASGVTS